LSQCQVTFASLLTGHDQLPATLLEQAPRVTTRAG
jgi:hypothetical protein